MASGQLGAGRGGEDDQIGWRCAERDPTEITERRVIRSTHDDHLHRHGEHAIGAQQRAVHRRVALRFPGERLYGLLGTHPIMVFARQSVKPREDFHHFNVDGTRHVLDAARTAGVPCFVHVGTEAALCDGTPLVNVDESRPLPERALARYPT